MVVCEGLLMWLCVKGYQYGCGCGYRYRDAHFNCHMIMFLTKLGIPGTLYKYMVTVHGFQHFNH